MEQQTLVSSIQFCFKTGWSWLDLPCTKCSICQLLDSC